MNKLTEIRLRLVDFRKRLEWIDGLSDDLGELSDIIVEIEKLEREAE